MSLHNDSCKTCGHDRADHIYEEGACRPGFICQRECDKFVSAIQKPNTVTITISRGDAERWLRRHRDDACTLDNCTASDCVVERALRAALEEER